MADIKWSSFPDEGTITTGDEIVGLRAAANVRLTANEFNTLTAFGDVKVGSSTTSVPVSQLQIAKDNTQGALNVSKYTASSEGALLYLLASRGTTVGDFTAVTADDILGDIYFSGTDGTGNTTGSLIRGRSDGAVSAGVIPSNLQFFTNDAAGAGQIGMTLDSTQKLTLAEDMEVNGITVGVGAFDESTNVAVGASALSSNVGSTATTAVGDRALAVLTTALGNTAIGANCASSMGTGARNLLMGYSAANASDGSYNVIGGALSAQSLTTGSQNVILGYDSGNANSGGGVILTGAADNVIIGWRASLDDVDGSGCIAIGYEAVAAAATGATSGDDGPGLAIGSATAPVGFRGDASIYPAAGTSAGYLRIKINGTNYKMLLLADV